MTNFRQLIDDARRERGWSVYRLANEAGMNQQTVARFINGERDITQDRLAKLLDALDINVSPKPD